MPSTISVRYVPTEHAVVDGQVFATGAKPALCIRNGESALGVINSDEALSIVSLDLREHDRSPIVFYHGQPYPTDRIVEHFKRMAQTKAIDPRAKRLLDQYPNIDDDAPEKPVVKKTKPKKTTKAKEEKPNIIATVAMELKTTPQKVRKFLRAQGMKAPYTDEKQIRKLTKKGIE